MTLPIGNQNTLQDPELFLLLLDTESQERDLDELKELTNGTIKHITNFANNDHKRMYIISARYFDVTEKVKQNKQRFVIKLSETNTKLGRKATLLDLDNNESKEAGHLTGVGKKEAEGNGAWFFDNTDGTYYILK